MSAGVVIMLLVGGTFALIVLSAFVGARRGSRQFGTADDSLVEKARGQGVIEAQRNDHGGHWG